jgi:predicted porin
MKKSLLALAVLSAFTGAASAQSSVTLSGAIDLGVVRENGAWTMRTAGSSRTNFTLSGSEDLGGGMRAFFLANHRFSAATGQINAPQVATGNATFWRQAWVGLGGGFGDVRLGKMLMPLQDFNGNFDPFGTDTVGSTHTGGLNATVRSTNTIYYRSPSLGGLQLHAAIAAAENQISGECGSCVPLNAERNTGLGVAYGAGPLRVSLAWDRNSADQKTVGLYGAFNAGFADLMAQYEKGDRNAAQGGDSLGRWSIGAKVPMGQSVIKVGYTKWSDEEVSKFGLGLDYNLSKRTQLYTNVGKLSGDSQSSTAKKARFDAGIFHRF